MPSLGKVVSELEYNTLPSPMRRRLASNNTSKTNNDNNTAAVDVDSIVSEKQTEGHHCDPTKIEQEIMPRTDMEGNCSTDFRI